MSLADLQNSVFITYQDQQNSLFEAYKDLYSEITKNDNDFYINTIQLNSSAATNPSPGEYLFPLPSDFYKIRTVEYQQGSYWVPMERFALGDRGNPGAKPRYRFQGNNLWVIGWNYPGFTSSYTLRVHYYPPPVQPAFPDLPINYGRSITSAMLNTITQPSYFNIQTYNGNAIVSDRNYFYIQGGLNLWYESIDLQTSYLLYTGSSTIINTQYYKGNIYFIMSNTIYSCPFTSGQQTVSTPVAVTITGSPVVVNFNIFNNLIYYSTSSQTYSVPLAGGAATSLAINQTNDYNPLLGSTYFCWLGLIGGALVVNGVNLGGVYTQMYTDNNLTCWALDNLGNLNAIVLNMTTPAAPSITSTSVAATDVANIGNYVVSSNSTVGGIVTPYSPYIPITGLETLRFQALSAVADTSFSYPINSNEIGEIMAYQCAIDFKAKQDQNHDQLSQRKQELMERMIENMRRDDYKMERVSNVYGGRGGPFGEGSW